MPEYRRCPGCGNQAEVWWVDQNWLRCWFCFRWWDLEAAEAERLQLIDDRGGM